MEVVGSPDFTRYGKDAPLNAYYGIVVRLVLEAEWRGLATSMLFQGLEKVRADKAESLGGCGAVSDDTTFFREIFSPLFFNAAII